jgi:hypothetical protein
MTTESAGLERGYRRLLSVYPRRFRAEQGEEMLAVLMASAREGQRRPSGLDAVDVLKSALKMRLQYTPSGPANQDWANSLAVFAVLAPVFLLAAALLEVLVPYRVALSPRLSDLRGPFLGRYREIGGLVLFRVQGYDIAVGGLVVVAVLALLGLRRLALGAMVAAVIYWFVARYWIPEPLQLLFIGVYLIEAAALIAAPEPRHGRQLITWGHGMVLLAAAAAVQTATFLYDASGRPMTLAATQPHSVIYLVVSLVLAVAAAGLALVLKTNRYFMLLVVAMAYSFVMELAGPSNNSGGDLIGYPTPIHLIILFLPPLLVALGAIISAVIPPRSGAQASPGQA